MPKRRTDGTGSITKLPSGRFRAQKRIGGKLKSCGTFDSRAEAEMALKAPPAKRQAIDLISFGADYLDRRADDVRDIVNDRSRWRLYIEGDAIGSTVLTELTRRDVRQWLHRLKKRGLADQSLRNVLNLLRQALRDAEESDMIEENVTVGMSVRTKGGDTEDAWTYLDPDEQIALLNATPESAWHLVAFALGTGVRQGEQYALLVDDVDIVGREVTIRYGKPNAPTKNGRVRTTPLFGLGLEGVRRAMVTNRGLPLLFPSRTKRRDPGEVPERWLYSRTPGAPSGFKRWVKAAGIKRNIRWHDLRHTCATSLLAGWWGRKWSIDEVCMMLGHSSTKVTERYAHKVDDTLKRAGEETHMQQVELHGTAENDEKDGATYVGRTRGLRFTKPRDFVDSSSDFAGFAIAEFHERCTEDRDSIVSALLEATRLSYRKNDPLAEAQVLDLLSDAMAMLGRDR